MSGVRAQGELITALQYETGVKSGELSVSCSCRSRLPCGVRPARSSPGGRCHTLAPCAKHVGDAQSGSSSSAAHPFEIS